MRLATIAIFLFLALALPTAQSQAGSIEGPGGAQVSASGKLAKKKQLARALKKCRTIRKTIRRKACVRKAKRRYANRPGVKPTQPKPGSMFRVDVRDTYETDYFSPDYLQIQSGDSIEFIWSDLNQNPHNITLVSGPPGVNRTDYATPNSPSRNYRWVRRFDQVGTWSFVCSLHHLMRLTVQVGK